MAQIVKLRRSSVSGQKPTNTNLQLGELALNTTDGKVYMAKSGSLGPSVEELISTNTVNTGSIHLTGDITASNFVGTSSYSSDSDKLDGKHATEFATTGSNIFRGIQTITGSLFTSGSNELVGNTILSGTLKIEGQYPASEGSQSVSIKGNVDMNGFLKLDPVTSVIDNSISGAYLYVTSSTGDLYFAQNIKGFNNTTRLRWLEGNMYTGLLSGGILSAVTGSTTFSLQKGTGLFVELNASLTDDPYPTTKYVEWPTLTGQTLTYLTSSIQTFVGIDENGQIHQQPTAFNNGQYNTIITIGTIIHQNQSTVNASITYPNVAYGYKQRTYDFIKAFGALKLSGLDIVTSGSLGLNVASGTAWADGRNYQNDQNNPSYIVDTGTAVSKIFRYYQVSGTTFVRDTNNNLGYTSIDPTRYNNNGVLTTVPTQGSNLRYTNQRVFWYPNSATKGIVVYYGNTLYESLTDAAANVNFERFVEDENTKQNAIYLGSISIAGDGSFTTPTSFTILTAGIFRNVGGSGGGGSIPTARLTDLTDVEVIGVNNSDLLVYNDVTLKWEHSKSLNGSFNITGSLNVNGNVSATSLTGSINYNNLTDVPTLVSGSSQIDITGTTGYSTFSSSISTSIGELSSSVETTTSNIRSDFNLFTSSYNTGSFSGSFIGDGSQLYNIPASGVTGLSLDKIVNGNASASIDNNGFYVNRDVYIDGTLTAKELHIDYVTSSILYTSGSTKFGNTDDDTHQFTGSLHIKDEASDFSIVGNIFGQTYLQSLNGALVLNPGYGGVNINGANPDLKVDGYLNVDGFISSSTNFRGDGSGLYNLPYSGLTGVPTLISSSTQISYTGITDVPNNIVSSSSQIIDLGFLQTSSFNSFTQSYSTGSFTGSFVGDGSGLTNLPVQNINTASLATTGSNIFLGDQTITGSINITGTVDGVDISDFSSSINSRLNSVTASGGISAIYISDESNLQGTASYFDFTGPGVTATVNAGTASISISGGGGGSAIQGASQTYTQVSNAATWSINHSINSRTPVIEIYDDNYNVVIPTGIYNPGTYQTLVYFDVPQKGYAIISTGGGLTVSGANAILDQATLSSTWTFNHNLGTKYPVFNIFDINDDVIIPQRIHVVDENSAIIYFSDIRIGKAIASVGGNVSSATSSSYSANANLLDGKNSTEFAITGSNEFKGNQTITGSLTITQNLYVLGSSSLVYVTSSQLAVSASTISVNVFEPAERFGGLKVYDSGSSSATASLLWDSQNNHWVYQNVSGSDYSGGMFLAGPRNTGSLGDEVGLINGRIPKSIGGDHLDNSIISEIGTTITIGGNLTADSLTGSINFNNLTNLPTLVSGSSQLTGSYDTRYVLSGSITQTTWNNIANKPNDIVSSSAQISEFGFAITGSNTFIGDQVLSGSLELTQNLVVKNDSYFGSGASDRLFLSGSQYVENGAIRILANNTFVDDYADDYFELGDALVATGSVKISGSLSVTGGITGTLFGSSSYATFALSASSAPGFTTNMIQATPATTWSFVHNLNTRNPIVQVYDSSYNQIIPNEIVGINDSTVEIRFDYLQSGHAVASNGGGLYITGSTSRINQTSNATTWSFTHNLGTKYPSFEVFDGGDNVIIPAGIKATTINTAEIYFAIPTSGVAIANFSGVNGFQENSVTSSFALATKWNTIQDNPISGSLTTAVSGTTTTILSVSTGSYYGAFFDYVVVSGSNSRAGTLMSTWNGSNVVYNESTTNDIGNTNEVTMSVDLNGTDVRLRATNTNQWSVRSLIRLI